MEVDLFTFISGFWAGIQDSFFFLTLKFFLFVYVSVLLVDIVLLLAGRNLIADFKKDLFGAEVPMSPKPVFAGRWNKILARLDTDNASQYKVAILEADQIADEMLAESGYHGETMAEKMQHVHAGALENRELLIQAHEVRNQIVHDKDFTLSRDEAQAVLDKYRRFFEELELLV